MKVGVIGGGAAGFFAAIAVKENYPTASVTIFEKSKKLLSKVKISGGGRCNVTNGCMDVGELCNAYPRGGKKLKKAFYVFNTRHTIEWFEQRGVPLLVQEDNCVFPVSQDSQSIIDCFLSETKRLEINIQTEASVSAISPQNDGSLTLYFTENHTETFDKVIVATGGSPKRKGLEWLEALHHKIQDPVPSLFTFNMPNEAITQLMGVVVDPALVSLQSSKLRSEGALLITHWGMSGPAILKLSAYGARVLSELNYQFKIQVNWTNTPNNEVVATYLQKIADEHPNKLLSNICPYQLPKRLWAYLLEKTDFAPHRKWSELGKKGVHKLMTVLTNDAYQVEGKTTFKEEFVTCGGVHLDSVNIQTMESIVCKNLYFAGEVLDIDAITGGYNFQAAWTTAFIAGKLA